MPQHSRALSKPGRKRAKPPSYELTSDETMTFVRNSKATAKERTMSSKNVNPPKISQRKKRRRSATINKADMATDNTPCTWCHIQYGDSNDPLLYDSWMACTVCGHWYHSSCAEQDGVLEDDGKLFCSACIS